VSSPPSPVKVSAPAPPRNVSLPLLPSRSLSAAEPARVSPADPPQTRSTSLRTLSPSPDEPSPALSSSVIVSALVRAV
jgi:hypothetical protein